MPDSSSTNYYVQKCLSFLDNIISVTIALVLPFYLDGIIKVWSCIITPIVYVLLYFGLIGDVSYLMNHVQWVKENSHFRVSSWLSSGHMLSAVTDKPDLVIAAYKEDLGWLLKYLPYVGHVYVYCKSHQSCASGIHALIRDNPQRFSVYNLPNIGRESHTYLTHIINHYDHLPNRTIFTMGSLNISWLRELSLRYSLADVGDMRYCHKFKASEISDLATYEVVPGKHPVSLGDGYNVYEQRDIIPARIRPLGNWLKNVADIDLLTLRSRCGWGKHGAIFSADRAMLHGLTKNQYLKLLEENSQGDSLEAGYYLEVSWRFLLGQLYTSKV